MPKCGHMECLVTDRVCLLSLGRGWGVELGCPSVSSAGYTECIVTGGGSACIQWGRVGGGWGTVEVATLTVGSAGHIECIMTAGVCLHSFHMCQGRQDALATAQCAFDCTTTIMLSLPACDELVRAGRDLSFQI